MYIYETRAHDLPIRIDNLGCLDFGDVASEDSDRVTIYSNRCEIAGITRPVYDHSSFDQLVPVGRLQPCLLLFNRLSAYTTWWRYVELRRNGEDGLD